MMSFSALVEKRGSIVYADGRKLRDLTQTFGFQFPKENLLIAQIPTNIGMVFNLLPGTMMIYGFAEPEQTQDYMRALSDGSANLVTFRVAATWGRGDPISELWRRRNLPPGLIAVQKVTAFPKGLRVPTKKRGLRKVVLGIDDQIAARFENLIFVDMMSVRSGWKRNGINLAILARLVAEFPDRTLAFSEPTPEGKKFIQRLVALGVPIAR